MDSVFVDGLSEISANSARRRVFRVGGPHQVTVLGHGVHAFQHLDHDRTGGHEADQVLEERALTVLGVETTGFLVVQLHHLHGHDVQAGLLEAADDFANHVFTYCVRLDNGQGALNSHLNSLQKIRKMPPPSRGPVLNRRIIRTCPVNLHHAPQQISEHPLTGSARRHFPRGMAFAYNTRVIYSGIQAVGHTPRRPATPLAGTHEAPMSNQADLDKLVRSEYAAGFSTAIESDTLPPGLNEDVIRFISGKKNEPQWLLDWRLEAYRKWQAMTPPTWAHIHHPPIDFNEVSYYSAPRSMADKPKSLDEVDPEL